jgi:CheY-like chemotaxis protein
MASHNQTILVIEDDPGLRALIQEVLSSKGYSVLVAPDGVDALRLVEEYPAEIQLLLTDLTLPGASGQEVAVRISALRPRIALLFMSGYASKELAQNGNLPEGNFIPKPWTPRALCEKIDAVLNAHPAPQRILVVDDEEGMREWLATVLEGLGHQVFTAQDGVEARRLATRMALDFLITDISMPNEEGLGTIRALRKAYPGLKIIAMSGANPESLMDAKLLGAHAVLQKPFTSDMLLKRMRAIGRARDAQPAPKLMDTATPGLG